MERGWKQCSRQGEEGPVKQEPFLLQAVLFFSFFSPSFSVFFFLWRVPPSWHMGRLQAVSRDTARETVAAADVTGQSLATKG